MHDSDKQRINVLLGLMLLTAVCGVFFAYHNALRDFFWAAALEALFVIYSVAMVPVIRRTPNFRRWALAYMLPWVFTMLAIVAMPGSSSTVFIWPLLLPLILHFLFGPRLGLQLSLAAMAAVAAIAWARFDLPQTPDDLVYGGNLALAGIVLLVLSHIYERGRELTESRLEKQAATDTLTGLPNRLHLAGTFEVFSARSRRDKAPLSVLLMDLDDFKRINDSHGHSAGDQVLAEFAVILRARMRGSDFLCRHGGEEFLALLPETDAEAASEIAESLRKRLEATTVHASGRQIRLTLSIGIAELDRDEHNLDTLLHIADKRLYRAKALGRNRVISTDD